MVEERVEILAGTRKHLGKGPRNDQPRIGCGRDLGLRSNRLTSIR